ncbi:GNAT family N-acetyltransferase [Vitiosangium sp. GDMCC 1.1324]|uniref:GNAT family N-acetyltransferase n=1 Tax=Vitiosangium sp. (strain GDMCC 1.1324) TaxID=2138576 RepID=UPI000D344010|nr:GNAT family N-acetyltransferase [Vitiosangium sp. GDMCC 1.1324]PTL84718.1 GNAT family N-acetyltransferase [Vitiosangium sp. GDMCC 1.1324]
MQAGWSIRKASVEDVDELIRLRLALHRTTRGVEKLEDEESLVEANRRYFARALPAGQFHAWVAVAEGRVVACSGLVPFERPPMPGNAVGLEAYIINMYTEPGWRGRGIARALFTELVRFARELGVGRLLLHATPDGRPLYESMGFKPNPTAMEWTLWPE